MSNKTLRITIVILSLSLCWLLIGWGNYAASSKEKDKKIFQLNKKVDSLKEISDSLYDENFINSTIVGRYELTLDYLREVSPRAALLFEEFLEHNTE